MKLSRLASVVVAGGLVFLAVGPYQRTAAAQGTPTKAPTAGKIDLRPRFRVGQETRFKMDMDSNGAQQAGDGPPVNQTVGATVLFRCIESNAETGYTLEVTYEALKLKAKAAGMNIDFDSSKAPKADDPMDEAIRSIVGMKLKVKMDLDGNISSVDGGGGGGMGGELMSGADLMKGMVGPIFTTKKGSGQVSVGDKWVNEDTMDAGMGTVRITTTNTVKSYSNSVATVDINGKFSVDPSSGKGVTIRDSSMNGEFRWNTEVGMLDSMTMKQKLTVEQKQDKGPPTHTSQDMNLKVQRMPGGNPGVAPKAPPAPKTTTPKGSDPSKK
jgi:hypothetical protein